MEDFQKRGNQFAEEANEKFEPMFHEILDREDVQSSTEVQFAQTLKRLFEEAQTEWYEGPHEELSGKGLSEYLQETEEEETLDFLYGMGEVLDFPLPPLVLPAIENLQDSGKNKLVAKIQAISPVNEEETDARLKQIYAVNQLLPLTSAIADKAQVLSYLDWYLKAPGAEERITDAVSMYLRASANISAEPLRERILEELAKENKNIEGIETLLQDLVAVSKFDDSLRGEAYNVLRKAFKVLDNKTITVISLGDLGTARAIPLLRTYIESNYNGIDKNLFFDMISAIHRLGGTTKDLPNPYRTYTGGGIDPLLTE